MVFHQEEVVGGIRCSSASILFGFRRHVELSKNDGTVFATIPIPYLRSHQHLFEIRRVGIAGEVVRFHAKSADEFAFEPADVDVPWVPLRSIREPSFVERLMESMSGSYVTPTSDRRLQFGLRPVAESEPVFVDPTSLLSFSAEERIVILVAVLWMGMMM